MSKERVLVSWSGGKDSAMALQAVLQSGDCEVAALLTTCTEGFRRVSMHGVRCSLLNQQADQLGLPLRKVFVPRDSTNEQYEAAMLAAMAEFKRSGIERIVFGDLFLEEIRAYRDRLTARAGLATWYPLWGSDTRELARRFIQQGFLATLVCVDERALDAAFAGRLFDEALLRELPASADPCGENGEFHTFVFDGPIFRAPVRHRIGARVHRQNFCYAELLPMTTRTKKAKI